MERSVAILAQAPWLKSRRERTACRARGRSIIIIITTTVIIIIIIIIINITIITIIIMIIIMMLIINNIQAACSLPAAYHVRGMLPLLQAVELLHSGYHPASGWFLHEVQCSVPTATSIAGCGRAQSAMWLEDP